MQCLVITEIVYTVDEVQVSVKVITFLQQQPALQLTRH